MAKLLACVCLIAALTGNALAAKPAAGTQLVEVRLSSDDSVKKINQALHDVKVAVANDVCAVPLADVKIASVEADVDKSGEATGSTVVVHCTPAAGELQAVKDSCIAGARQADSASWADNLNLNNVNCGEAVATGAGESTATGATTKGATNATTTAETSNNNNNGLLSAETLPGSSSDTTGTAAGAPAGAATAAPAAATAKSGAATAAASTVFMALAGAAALVLV